MHRSCYANACLIVRRSSAPRRHIVFLSMRLGIVFLSRLLLPRLQETCRRLCSSGVCPFHWHISNTVVLIWVVWCLFAWIDTRSSSKLSAKYSRREQTYVTKNKDIWSLLNCPQCVLPDNYVVKAPISHVLFVEHWCSHQHQKSTSDEHKTPHRDLCRTYHGSCNYSRELCVELRWSVACAMSKLVSMDMWSLWHWPWLIHLVYFRLFMLGRMFMRVIFCQVTFERNSVEPHLAGTFVFCFPRCRAWANVIARTSC